MKKFALWLITLFHFFYFFNISGGLDNIKKTLIVIISILLIISIQPTTAINDLKIVQYINFPDSNQTQPFIYEDLLAFVDDRNGNLDIYTYDLLYENITQITSDPQDQNNPYIQGSKMVWEDYRNGNWDIYLYNIYQESELQITNNSGNQKNPCIFRNYIAWEDDRNGNWDIYIYDFTSGEERQITNSTSYQVSPQMSQNRMDVELAWIDSGTGGTDNEIFSLRLKAFNESLENIKQVTDDQYDQSHLDTSLDNIVFSDNRDGHYNIFIYNYQLEVVDQITSDEVDQQNPAFDLEQIIWIDGRTGHPQVYQFNMIMQEQYRLTDTKTAKTDVQIYYKWIAWVEQRDNDKEIFYLNLDMNKSEKKSSDNMYLIVGLFLIFIAVLIIIKVIKKPKEKELPTPAEIKKIGNKDELKRLCRKFGLNADGNKKRLRRKLLNCIEENKPHD